MYKFLARICPSFTNYAIFAYCIYWTNSSNATHNGVTLHENA